MYRLDGFGNLTSELKEFYKNLYQEYNKILTRTFGNKLKKELLRLRIENHLGESLNLVQMTLIEKNFESLFPLVWGNYSDSIKISENFFFLDI